MCTSFGGALPAAAQSQVQTASLGAAVEAQFRAAIIRERRLADDRELRAIAEAEARMRSARANARAATSNRAEAEAALARARTNYTELVNADRLRDSAARIQVAAFRAEIDNVLATASPELIAAYQEFADGDRASAWTTLETLLRARAAARLAAARAVAASEVRQLAELREIMRINGEATGLHVLTLWDQAAELDPSHFWSQIHRTRLAQRDVGDLARAQSSATDALRAAASPYERMVALNELGELAVLRTDFPTALTQLMEAERIARARVEADPRDGVAWEDLHVALDRVAGAHIASGDYEAARPLVEEQHRVSTSLVRAVPGDAVFEEQLGMDLIALGDIAVEVDDDDSGAMRYFTEALALFRRLAAADRENLAIRRHVGLALDRVGMIYYNARMIPEASAAYAEALGIARRLVEADPASVNAQDALAAVLISFGNLEIARRDFTSALRYLGEAERINRGLLDAAPNNSDRRFTLAKLLLRQGQAHLESGAPRAALAPSREALPILLERSRSHPNDANSQVTYVLALWQLARTPGSGTSWAQVINAAEPLEARGMLDPGFTAELREYQSGARR